MTGDPDRDGGGDAPQANDKDDRPELDVETAFAALVAQFSAPPAPDVGGTPHPWPAAEDLTDADTRTISLDPRPTITPVVQPAAVIEPAYPAELDEHFVPPEPPPLPRGDTISRLAWAGVIGGPLVLLIAALFGGDLPAALLLAALAAFIGGFVTLVARMPGESPDDPDHGAVV